MINTQIDPGYSKWDTLTQCPVRRRLNARDIKIVLPWDMRKETDRVKRVMLEWLEPTALNVYIDPDISIVAASCGTGIEPHEARTIWDVLCAAADRAGKQLTVYGLMARDAAGVGVEEDND